MDGDRRDGSEASVATASAATASSVPGGSGVDRRLLEFLVCPVTRGPLVYDAERGELVSRGANLAFPIQNGIPIMLVDEARPLDQ